MEESGRKWVKMVENRIKYRAPRANEAKSLVSLGNEAKRKKMVMKWVKVK